MIKLFRKGTTSTKAPVNNYRVKPFTIKSTIPMKIGKSILWVVIVFLLLKGAAGILKGNQNGRVDEQISSYTAAADRKLKLEQETSDFAENFVREYLTYKERGDEDYEKRISSFVASHIADAGIYSLNGNGQCEVLETWTIKRNWYSEKQINVDVKAKVKYINATQQNIESQNEDGSIGNKTVENLKETYSEIYLRVPIEEAGGKYVVSDLPIFIAAPDKAEIEYEKYYTTTADEAVSEQIEETLNSFFKAYYTSDTGELNYFMSDNTKNVKGLAGRFIFTKLDDAMVFKCEEEGSYIAIVQFFIEDIYSKQSIKQTFHVELETKEARYFIREFDTRIGNLNYI